MLSFHRQRAINMIRIRRIYSHTGTVTFLQVWCLVKMTTGVAKECLLPFVSVPLRIIVIMGILITADSYHCNDRIIILIQSNLPYPITCGWIIYQSRWILTHIVTRLIHFKSTVSNSRKSIPLNILQLQRMNIYIIKVQKIRILIIRMTGRISKINFIFPIRHILGIRTGPGRLYYLIRSPFHRHLIILIGQRQLGDSRVPANPPPT